MQHASGDTFPRFARSHRELGCFWVCAGLIMAAVASGVALPLFRGNQVPVGDESRREWSAATVAESKLRAGPLIDWAQRFHRSNLRWPRSREELEAFCGCAFEAPVAGDCEWVFAVEVDCLNLMFKDSIATARWQLTLCKIRIGEDSVSEWECW